MHQWLAFPWLRYSFWLIVGILAAGVFYVPAVVVLLTGGMSVLWYLLAVWLVKPDKAGAGLLCGMLAFISITAAGYYRMQTALQPPQNISLAAELWWVEVVGVPAQSIHNFRFKGRIIRADSTAAAFSVMVYFPSSTFKPGKAPQPGQQWLVEGSLREVPSPLNPREFDYRNYLRAQRIHHQLFAKKLAQASVETSFWNSLENYAYNSRAYLLDVFAAFISDTKALMLVNAMVMGEKASLDRSMRQAYADAGVMHVLAVSGLHVGILFGPLLWGYRYFQRRKGQRLLWLLLVLLILWSYAWLTGLAPSAMRATLMFSLIAAGKTQKRAGNIYNSIGLSCFLLLLADPLLLRQVGFQLSYLAVTGIVYLQPRIRRWYEPAARWKKVLWELFTVSLAAQLATFPLGLYYFNQFPTYFFVGNFLAVPLASFIVYGSLLLMLFHPIPLLNQLSGFVVDYLARLLNLWVALTESLPYSRLVAAITGWESVLFYAILFSLIILFRTRRFGMALLSFCLLLGLAGNGIARTIRQHKQSLLVIYHIPKHSLLHLVQGKQDLLIPIGEEPDEAQLQYHVAPMRVWLGLESLTSQTKGNTMAEGSGLATYKLPDSGVEPPQAIMDGIQYLSWQGLNIAVICGKQPFKLPDKAIRVDVVLLRQNPHIEPRQLMQRLNPGQLVLDGSNGRRYAEKLEYEAKLLDLPLHLTAKAGAYQLKL